MQRLLLTLVAAASLLSFTSAGPCKPGELRDTEPFTVIALNSSYPDIDGKFVWTYSGATYLDAGVANPRMSYPLIAQLKDTSLVRLPQQGSPPENIGNLNFGTSNVCCNFAALKFNTEATIPFSSRTKPFFVDQAGNLQWEEKAFRNERWYVCTKGEQKQVYWGLPFYEFPDPPKGAEKACTVVSLATVRPLPTAAPGS